MKVAVQRWGHSLAVRIPKAIAVESDLDDGAVVDLKLIEGRVVLIPVRPRKYRLQDLLGGVTEENLHHEVDAGPPTGKESW